MDELELIEKINKKLADMPLFYITQDPAWAMGLEKLHPYAVITNAHPLAKKLEQQGISVFQNSEEEPADSWELLKRSAVQTYIQEKSNGRKPAIITVKNTPLFDRMCRELDYQLLNPVSELMEQFESKSKQSEWFDDIQEEIPIVPFLHGILNEFSFEKIEKKFGLPFIIQFNRGHTGTATQKIISADAWNALINQFPERTVRVSKLLNGFSFTINAIVSQGAVYGKNISYQITGVSPLTDLPFATVGVDWGVATHFLSPVTKKQFIDIVQKIGKSMYEQNWKGLFGIDALWEPDQKRWYVIEVNARQPSSASYESKLQQERGSIGIMILHVASLLDISLEGITIEKIDEGTQCFFRTHKTPLPLGKLELPECTVIENPIHWQKGQGRVIYCVQSKKSLLKGPADWSDTGKQMLAQACA